MKTRLPIGSKLVKAYYVLLPFRGASEAAGQAVDKTTTDTLEDFVLMRDAAVITYWQNLAVAEKRGSVITDENSRPVIVHRVFFEHPEGGGSDFELERETLTDGMIDVAKKTLGVDQETIQMMVRRTRWVVTGDGGLHRV
jgi:hypothetical protein